MIIPALDGSLKNASGGGGNDPNFSSVSLLLKGEGTDNSTTIVDSSGNALNGTSTKVANRTSNSKFGTGSIGKLNPGTQEKWSLNYNSSLLAFGTGNFTIECWFYRSTSDPDPGGDVFLGIFDSIDQSQSYNLTPEFGGLSTSGIGIYVSRLGKFRVLIHNGDGDNAPETMSLGYNTNGSVPANTWTHLAVVRASNVFNSYINGVAGSASYNTSSFSFTNTNAAVCINRGYQSLLVYNMYNSLIDELRITKVARYTANFTPPTASFPTS